MLKCLEGLVPVVEDWHAKMKVSYIRYASKKSVRKVSNGREITFEVLRSVCEMYM